MGTCPHPFHSGSFSLPLFLTVFHGKKSHQTWVTLGDLCINCSHPGIQTGDMIYWYRQLPGRGPTFLVVAHKGSKELTDPPGWLRVAADRRSSALWLARPRRGDAAVYYCALR
uniref:Ig-like domain-containing protein n=1 Tax=Calidris pygmaea TaxID=425635 RepID=A0A8C3PQN6_9CHAR